MCERVLSDVIVPNKLSYINVITGFNSDGFPFFTPPMFIVAQYGLGQGEFRHHFEIQDSEGEILFRSPARDFFLDNRTAVHSDIAGVEGLKIIRHGIYWVKSFIGSEIKTEIPFNINYLPSKTGKPDGKADESQ